MTDPQLLAVAGVIAAILAGVDVYRTRGNDLAAWGVLVIGVALLLVYLTA